MKDRALQIASPLILLTTSAASCARARARMAPGPMTTQIVSAKRLSDARFGGTLFRTSQA